MDEKAIRYGCDWLLGVIRDQAQQRYVGLTPNTPTWTSPDQLGGYNLELLLATGYMEAKPYWISTKDLEGVGRGDKQSKQMLQAWVSQTLTDILNGKPGA